MYYLGMRRRFLFQFRFKFVTVSSIIMLIAKKRKSRYEGSKNVSLVQTMAGKMAHVLRVPADST